MTERYHIKKNGKWLLADDKWTTKKERAKKLSFHEACMLNNSIGGKVTLGAS